MNSLILREYIWSSFITFIAAFGTAILPMLGGATWNKAAIFALLAVGIRAGVKAVLNLLTTTTTESGATISSKP